MLIFDDASRYKTYVFTRCCASEGRATEKAAIGESFGMDIVGRATPISIIISPRPTPQQLEGL